MSSKAVTDRLKRLSGQLQKLQTNISDDAACSEVVPQFLAVRGALNAAFEVYIKDSLQHCSLENEAERDQLIAMLVRK